MTPSNPLPLILAACKLIIIIAMIGRWTQHLYTSDSGHVSVYVWSPLKSWDILFMEGKSQNLYTSATDGRECSIRESYFLISS